MTDDLFDQVADALEAGTSLDKLEARGTLRIGLKEAGLDAKRVTPEQMRVVLKELMPAQLESRGIDSASDVCDMLIGVVGDGSRFAAEDGDSPEALFARLGGSSAT
jgi:hypothetical protein